MFASPTRREFIRRTVYAGAGLWVLGGAVPETAQMPGRSRSIPMTARRLDCVIVGLLMLWGVGVYGTSPVEACCTGSPCVCINRCFDIPNTCPPCGDCEWCYWGANDGHGGCEPLCESGQSCCAGDNGFDCCDEDEHCCVAPDGIGYCCEDTQTCCKDICCNAETPKCCRYQDYSYDAAYCCEDDQICCGSSSCCEPYWCCIENGDDKCCAIPGSDCPSCVGVPECDLAFQVVQPTSAECQIEGCGMTYWHGIKDLVIDACRDGDCEAISYWFYVTIELVSGLCTDNFTDISGSQDPER